MAEQKESNEELVSNLANKPRVFISYARADASDFAEYLAAALKFAGFDAYLDRYNIAKAEDWEARLGDLIAKSDTIIFIITPQSVNSTRCDWEIKRTVAMSKRLVPVQWISVPEADVPVELKRLNYTIFTTGESFSAPLAELVDTLRQDLDWLRQQTQLNEQAGRWHGRERDPDLLLRGTEISEARAWLQHRKPSAPELSPVLKAYIGSSEEAEKARQSEEHRQLAEREKMVADVEVAQKSQADALKRAEQATTEKLKASRRIVQRTVVGLITALLLAAVAVGLFLYAVAAKKDVDNIIKRINVGVSKDSGVAASKKICEEAIEVTSKLAIKNDDAISAEQRFWELYYGEMNLIELRQKTKSYIEDAGDLTDSSIESAMVAFGNTLTAIKSGEDSSSLQERAKEVKTECDAFLKQRD
ncbi:MAG: toll/interleukin-1 receptor domain-containing protein [Nitrospinales bacterium]